MVYGIKPFTAADVQAEVEGVIGSWMNTYTEPEDDQPQRRMRVEHNENGVAIVRVDASRFTGEPDRRFRITYQVEELR